MDNNISRKTTYKDYNGNILPEHDGTLIELDGIGTQYFDVTGQGFLHDGAVVKLTDGRKQFFMGDGKAIIHDGSPIELPDGMTQYFDYEGRALWPVDEKRLVPLFTKQREAFFQDRIAHISKQMPLSENEIDDIRLALLAAEHPDYDAGPMRFQHLPEMEYLEAV